MSHCGVDIAKKKVPDATFIVADVSKVTEPMAPYRKWATHATCSEVLEHLDDPIGFLKAARYWLADGAEIIVTVPGGPMSLFDKHIGHRQHFSPSSIHRTLDMAGYKVKYIYRSGFPFFNLYRLMVIARGRKLIDDVRSGQGAGNAWLPLAAMAVFRWLFLFNLVDSAFGWQIAVVAQKKYP